MDTNEPGDHGRWTDHLARACDAFVTEMRQAVPDGFSTHARGSMREALMAMRSLLDAGIDHLETKPEQTARKVEVE